MINDTENNDLEINLESPTELLDKAEFETDDNALLNDEVKQSAESVANSSHSSITEASETISELVSEPTSESLQQPSISNPVTALKNADGEYRVLARKYRPMNFDSLIGQEALVRTLTNALKTGRVAQAFMLTGVRGVGKTTTARIVAKALNCDAVDANGNLPTKPCGVCCHCTDIDAGRHIDVMEMDAASNTGIDDIREIIESTQYAPNMARYKIYILDEVHMLSKNAFNGLLKTLEEPPAHVKFIFATTEIGKVPVTILSRCQRFDLRRVSVDDLFEHYKDITVKEGFEVDDDAIRIIARSADGSVRDGLSILDQALALSDNKKVTIDGVISMLGLADRQAIYTLYNLLMRGDAQNALQKIHDLYDTGAEAVVILQDLMDVTWWLTRFKVTPALASDPSTPEIEKNAGKDMAEKLSMAVLTRTWQILNKGLEEVLLAERSIMALEMVAVRLMYSTDLPTPESLVKKMTDPNNPAPINNSSGTNADTCLPKIIKNNTNDKASAGFLDSTQKPLSGSEINISTEKNNSDVNEYPILTPVVMEGNSRPETFVDWVEILQGKSPILGNKIYSLAKLVSYEAPLIILQLDDFSRDEKASIHRVIKKYFGEDWTLEITTDGGQETLEENDLNKEKEILLQADNLSLVKMVKSQFPNAVVTNVNGVDDI